MRLFVAADLPDHIRVACARWRDEAVASRPALRPVPDESLHVTLSFLGTRDAGHITRLAEALEGCVRAADGLVLGGPRWLPPRRPRTLALELEDRQGELGALRTAVAAAIGDEEARPFLPHVTLARTRAEQRVRPGGLPAPPPVAFGAAALTLYRSHTAPAGAVYEPLWRRAL